MGIEINDSNKTIDHEIEKFSRRRFNWPVLLFGYLWFFWKRMYKFGTILFLVSLLTAIFVVMIKLPAFVDSYSFIIKGIGDFEYEVLVWGILLFVPNYILSLFADNLYVKKLKKQMSTTTVDKSPFYAVADPFQSEPEFRTFRKSRTLQTAIRLPSFLGAGKAPDLHKRQMVARETPSSISTTGKRT